MRDRTLQLRRYGLSISHYSPSPIHGAIPSITELLQGEVYASTSPAQCSMYSLPGGEPCSPDIPSLWNFTQVLYTLFTAAVNAKISNPFYLHTIQPTLRQFLTFAQASLGSADKMTFSLTHVLLMTLCLVLTVQLNNLRSAVDTSSRR